MFSGKTLEWKFPMKRTHTGILIGNGIQGIMVWGYDNQLNITLGRAGFWDHRGGNEFASRTTFKEVKKLLYAGNEEGLRQAFAVPEKEDHSPPRPQQIGGGRLELYFPENYNIEKGTLVIDNGTVFILVTDPDGGDHSIKIRQSMIQETSWVEIPDDLSDSVDLKLVPSWEYVKEELMKYGVQPPEVWSNGNSGGFIQRLPADDPLAIAYKKDKNLIILSSALDQDARASAELKNENFELQSTRDETNQWWEAYWKDVPKIKLPDPVLQEIVDYGQYKLACVTPPQGLPCSLQGPFNEEYQLPPWSNDYHFNINIEMIYWPVLASNRLSHLDPLWGMIQSWWPQLSSNGEKFFQQEGAIMLPHAVDDRCQVVGTFWTGTIDHACTAWMSQLAWMHYRYSMDENILKNTAWPLMVGAFEGYWAMLEEIKGQDGKMRLSLPVSVSPEFKGSRMDAWGRDASFQLEALHMVAENLTKAAGVLGEEPDPRWAKVKESLPPYSTIIGPRTLEWPEDKRERIALWEGMDLIESHRHHSYLSGIWPFMSFNPLDSAHQEIVRNTLENWVLKGPGLWSGWCVPWASVIHSRIDHARAAVEWLHFWKRNFTNEGRGTLHNAAFPGTTLIDSQDYRDYEPGQEHHEVMQLDAGFGALSAVYELLVQDRRGVIHVLPDIPSNWSNLTFEGILTEGGFKISAKLINGEISEIEIDAQYDGPLHLAHGMGKRYRLNEKEMEGEILDLDARAGQKFILLPLNL
jgi:alpha-L-fucosidase 2